jgi:MOSC domain-containing protein YiiM
MQFRQQSECVRYPIRSNFSRDGRLDWIGLRSAHRQPMHSVVEAQAAADRGLEGDRASGRPGGKRQVTLIQAEHLSLIAGFVGLPEVSPALVRRNLVVSGLNLNALDNKRFYVGDVLLEATGHCHPCARMEEALGLGGYNALRGHGGLTARVLTSGVIRIGDVVHAVPFYSK